MALGAYGQSADFEKRLLAGQQLRAAGRYQEAHRTFEALLGESRRFDPAGLAVATVLDNLAITEQDLGNLPGAERLVTDALAQLKRAGETGGPAFALAKSHLGEVYLEEQRYREAEMVLRQALQIRQNEENPDPGRLATVMVDLAVACKHTRGLREAESILQQALSLLEVRLGPQNALLAVALGPLASVLMKSRRYDEALVYAERSWQILSRNPTVAEPDLLNAMGALGALYSQTGRGTEAESFARQAATRAETIYGPEHPRVGWYLKNYADVLKRLGRKAEAKSLEKRSATILARTGQSNPAHHTIDVSALR